MTIGFIGQGYIGKNYADDFERRGYTVVRYSLEAPYAANKEKIKACDVVFIAVPTPTTPAGSDDSAVLKVIELVGAGKVAVIKSTIMPGTTKKFQELFPSRTILFSPEFLREATAAHDAAYPYMSIVGVPDSGEEHRRAAERVVGILPQAPFVEVCDSTEAELIKYIQNVSGYAEIIMFNIFYDLAQKLGAGWEPIKKALEADPNIASRFANPVHKGGRGAGGPCLIKDFAAFAVLYRQLYPHDAHALAILGSLADKNLELLKNSKKNLDIVQAVYGTEHI